MDSTNPFITTIEEITPQRISKLLLGSSALQAGSVTDVQIVQDLHPPMSNIACILKLSYSSDAEGALPTTVFFKNGRIFGEVGFARHVAPLLSHSSMVKCHSALFENKLGQSNLIFEDIQASHKFFDSNIELDYAELQHVVLTLAGFHRIGWEHPKFASTGQIGSNLNDLPNNLALPRARQMLDSFFEAMGSELSTKQKTRYQRIFDLLPHPAWTNRRDNLINMTLVHGDVHTGNLALPINAKESVRLLDWSLWHINFPTYDLSYLLALHTKPEIRKKIEKKLLEQYHAALGVYKYSFEQLIDDYRISILFQTVWPVFFHSFAPQEIWKPLHNNIVEAFDDWSCEELLD